MISIYLCFFALPVFIFFLILLDNYEISNIFISLLGSLFFSGLIFSFYISYKRLYLETEERILYECELNSLDAKSSVNGKYNGSFLVGSGYIGEQLYYNFYYKTKDGLKYTKYKAQDIYIKETDSVPRFVVYADFVIDTTNIYYKSGSLNITKKVLFIPKGTIKQDYKHE